jgi:hypothetical protein
MYSIGGYAKTPFLNYFDESEKREKDIISLSQWHTQLLNFLSPFDLRQTGFFRDSLKRDIA